MLGAIIGDIAGSTYEVKEVNALKKGLKVSYEDRIKILNKNVPLFDSNSSCTDDTILTSAVADAIMNNGDFYKYIKEYATHEINLGLDKYGRSRFGSRFIGWVNGNQDNNSIGNGAAMRVSPIANYYNDLNTIIKKTTESTIVSHNTIEAVISTITVSICIFLARNNYSKEAIKQVIEKIYNINFNLENLQKNYKFSAVASNSVPQAIYCFLISNDFEDSIRTAISIGGDSDTIAAITGSISEAYYGIPNNIIEEANKYIPDYIKEVIDKFYKKENVKKLVKGNTYGGTSKKIN